MSDPLREMELCRPNQDEAAKASGFLLCGGKSSRMGTDKALLLLNGEPLVQRGLRILREVCAQVAIAGGTEALKPFGRVIPDEITGCGPLGGIVSAMEQSTSELNLFLPVDAPFVPAAALNQLLYTAFALSPVGVMARVAGRLQPLCAVYSRKALPILRTQIAAGNRKVVDAFAAAGMCRIIDFGEESWFRNLNTPEQFAEAEQDI